MSRTSGVLHYTFAGAIGFAGQQQWKVLKSAHNFVTLGVPLPEAGTFHVREVCVRQYNPWGWGMINSIGQQSNDELHGHIYVARLDELPTASDEANYNKVRDGERINAIGGPFGIFEHSYRMDDRIQSEGFLCVATRVARFDFLETTTAGNTFLYCEVTVTGAIIQDV